MAAAETSVLPARAGRIVFPAGAQLVRLFTEFWPEMNSVNASYPYRYLVNQQHTYQLAGRRRSNTSLRGQRAGDRLVNHTVARRDQPPRAGIQSPDTQLCNGTLTQSLLAHSGSLTLLAAVHHAQSIPAPVGLHRPGSGGIAAGGWPANGRPARKAAMAFRERAPAGTTHVQLARAQLSGPVRDHV